MEYQCIQGTEEGKNSPSQWLTGVLEEYPEVFQEPQGLPPSGEHDHAIVKEGANVPNLKPYRYPLPKE